MSSTGWPILPGPCPVLAPTRPHHRLPASPNLRDRPNGQAVSKKSLWEMGLQIFRTHLNQRAEVSRKTVQGLLTLVEKERNGDQACPARTRTRALTSHLEACH